MGAETGAQIKDAGTALFAAATAAGVAAVTESLVRTKIHFEVTDGGTAGTDAAEKVVYVNNTGSSLRIVSLSISAPVAVTANDTNFKNFNLFTRTSAGATQVAVGVAATTTTGTGSLVAFAPLTQTTTSTLVPFTAANVTVAAGSVVTFSMTHGGTGVAVGSATAGVGLDLVLEKVG